MSGESALLTRSWPVGARTVTLTIPKPRPGAPVCATAEWSPTEPTRLSTDEWKQYRMGRNEALAQLAGELGISVAVLDI